MFTSFLLTEVQLYLIILELMEKWQEALDLVKGQLGGKITENVVKGSLGDSLYRM